MALVLIDVIETAWTNNSVTSPTTTVDASAVDLVEVGVMIRNNDGKTISGVTADGEAMTRHETVAVSASPRMDTDIFKRTLADGLDQSSSLDIVVTASAAVGGAGNDGVIIIKLWSGADQSTPLGTSVFYEATGEQVPPYSKLDASVSDAVAGAVSDYAFINGPNTLTLTEGAGQTAGTKTSGGAVATCNSSVKARAAATSTSVHWDYTDSLYNGTLRAVPVREAASTPVTGTGALAAQSAAVAGTAITFQVVTGASILIDSMSMFLNLDFAPVDGDKVGIPRDWLGSELTLNANGTFTVTPALPDDTEIPRISYDASADTWHEDTVTLSTTGTLTIYATGALQAQASHVAGSANVNGMAGDVTTWIRQQTRGWVRRWIRRQLP